MLFTRPIQLTSISTSSRNSKPYWITEYTLEYLTLDYRWTKYKENGKVKVNIGIYIALYLDYTIV